MGATFSGPSITVDETAEAVWLRIGRAIEELLSEERPEDAEVH